MRRLRYGVAMSLDGFIAGPNGEHDWIVPDPAMDFDGLFAQFDTLLMGRKTFEIAKTRPLSAGSSSQQWIVVSRTLKPEDYPKIAILSSGVEQAVAAMKAQPGKDIWLFGGGVLFRFLLDAGLIDTVEVAIIPVLLGSGVPLLTEGRRRSLHFQESKALPSGVLQLCYAVLPESKVD